MTRETHKKATKEVFDKTRSVHFSRKPHNHALSHPSASNYQWEKKVANPLFRGTLSDVFENSRFYQLLPVKEWLENAPLRAWQELVIPILSKTPQTAMNAQTFSTIGIPYPWGKRAFCPRDSKISASFFGRFRQNEQILAKTRWIRYKSRYGLSNLHLDNSRVPHRQCY